MVPHALVLHSGGLRSLVATALAVHEAGKARVSLLHVVDGRENAVARVNHVQRQAQHFGIRRVHELDMPHLRVHAPAQDGQAPPTNTLGHSQMLLAAGAQVRRREMGKLVWAASFNALVEPATRATEQIQLVSQLLELEPEGPAPRLEAPLLELTDQQILELGAQLGVPWDLAWSCLFNGDAPCGMCPGCIRRKAAFTKAGLTDPAVSAASPA